MKKNILILGARSDIGMAIAHRFAEDGYAVQLAARNVKTLEANKEDITLRYQVEVSLHEFDVLATDTHISFIESLPTLPDVAVCVVGYMGEQSKSEADIPAAIEVMRSNYEGPANILASLYNHFENRGSGTLIGISSVAGDRGRATNYVYGSAKAGFTAFLSGLRNRGAKKEVHVVTIKPGFVRTQMTEGMDLPTRLTAEPEEVANRVFKAHKKSKNVIYVKSIWWLVMLVIGLIPEFIFKKMKL